MWKYMESTRPSVFVKNYEEGISTVKAGGYAFLMESTVLDYVVQVSREEPKNREKNIITHLQECQKYIRYLPGKPNKVSNFPWPVLKI